MEKRSLLTSTAAIESGYKVESGYTEGGKKIKLRISSKIIHSAYYFNEYILIQALMHYAP